MCRVHHLVVVISVVAVAAPFHLPFVLFVCHSSAAFVAARNLEQTRTHTPTSRLTIIHARPVKVNTTAKPLMAFGYGISQATYTPNRHHINIENRSYNVRTNCDRASHSSTNHNYGFNDCSEIMARSIFYGFQFAYMVCMVCDRVACIVLFVSLGHSRHFFRPRSFLHFSWRKLK